MPGLFSSIAEIIEGFVHTIFALIGTALNIPRVFLKETLGLATETVEFVLLLFVGYQQYQQNTARVQTRSSKKLQ
ncbi:hypothetical protein JCM11251_003754 [Rhodosporidiobolus azoricus]